MGRFRDSDLLRRLFETVLARCIAEGLVGGEGFAVDGSLIRADANRQKGVEGSAGLPPEAVSRAAREYLAVLDEAAFGAATPVPPKFISPADPAARWTGAHGGQAFFAYTANYLIDLDHAIIVDVEADHGHPASRGHSGQAHDSSVRASTSTSIRPSWLATAVTVRPRCWAWLVYEQGIEPHISVFDKSTRTDGTFSRADFTYDQPGDVYRCPTGQVLTTTGTLVNDGATLLYRASKFDCAPCP